MKTDEWLAEFVTELIVALTAAQRELSADCKAEANPQVKVSLLTAGLAVNAVQGAVLKARMKASAASTDLRGGSEPSAPRIG